jgi:excisionase family DNA binding protein
MPSKKFFSVKEASKIIGVSTNTVYKYLDDGSLKGKRMGGRGRFKIPFSELAPYFSKVAPSEVTEVATDEVPNESSFFGSILETVSIGLSALLILWVFGSVTLGTEPAPMKNVGGAVLSYSGRTFSGFGNLVSQLMPAKKTENPEVAGANVSVPTTPPTEAVPEQKTADLNYKLKDTERLIYELYVNAQSLAADAQKLLGKSRTLTAAELNDQLVGMSQLLGSSSGTADESTIYAQVGRLTDSWNFPALDPLERSLDQVSSSLDRLSQKSLGAFTKPEVKDLNDLVAQTDLLQRLVGTITDTSAEPTVFGNLRKAEVLVMSASPSGQISEVPVENTATPSAKPIPVVEATYAPQVAAVNTQTSPTEATPSSSPQVAGIATQIVLDTPTPTPAPQVAAVNTQAVSTEPTPAPVFYAVVAKVASVLTPDVQRIIGAGISLFALGALEIYLLVISRKVWLRILRAVVMFPVKVVSAVIKAVFTIYKFVVKVILSLIKGFYRVMVAVVMFPVKVVRAVVTAIVVFFRKVAKVLVSIAKFIFSIPGRVLTFFVFLALGIKRIIVSTISSIKKFVTQAVNAIITFISNIISAVKNFFVSFINSIKQVVIGTAKAIVTFVSNIISAVKSLIKDIALAVKKAILSIKSGILMVLVSIKVFFVNIIRLIKKFIVSAVAGIFRGADATDRAVRKFVGGVKAAAVRMTGLVKMGIIRSITAVKNLFLNIVSSISKFIVTVTGAIVRFIVRVINSIITFIEKIILAVTKVVTFIVTGVINILVAIVTFFLKTISLVTRALALVMGGLYKILVAVTERTDSTLGSIHFEPSQSRGSHIHYRKASIFILVVILSAVVSAVFGITVLAQIEKGPTTSLQVEEISVNDITKKPSLDLPKEEKIVVQETGTGWLRVRSTPGGSEIGKVYPGERYLLLDQKDGWVLIALPAGQKGWVSSKYISFE